MASPLSRALQRLIRRIESNGHTVVFGLVPEYEKGLNTVGINQLAVAAGFHAIFETGETLHGDRWLRVGYPDPAEAPAEFIIWSREPTAIKVRETCATTIDILREWVDVALQQPINRVDPDDAGRTPESLITALSRLIEILLRDRDALESATVIDADNADLQRRRRDWLTGITAGFKPMNGRTGDELSRLRPPVGSAEYRLAVRVANVAAIHEGVGNHVLPLLREAELAHDELIEIAHHEAYDQGKRLVLPQRHSDAVCALIALVPPPSTSATVVTPAADDDEGTPVGEITLFPKTEQKSFSAKDRFGSRTLIAQPSVAAWVGNPIPALLDIEAATGVRLRDGGDPVWFLRVYHGATKRFRESNSSRTFAEYCEMLHSELIEITDLRSRVAGDAEEPREDSLPSNTLNAKVNGISEVPRALVVAARDITGRLTDLQKRYSGSLKCVEFDTDTIDHAIRFIDEFNHVDGGYDELRRRVGVLSFHPPTSSGNKLQDSWGAVRSDVFAAYDAVKPEGGVLQPLEVRIELAMRGFQSLLALVQFDEFFQLALNGTIPLGLFNLEQFRNALSRSLQRAEWKEDVAARLQTVLAAADSLWNEARRADAEGCRMLLALSRREPEPMLTSSAVDSMLLAVEALVDWSTADGQQRPHRTQSLLPEGARAEFEVDQPGAIQRRSSLQVTYRDLSRLVGGLKSHQTIKNRMTKDRKGGKLVPSPVSNGNGMASRFAYADVLAWWPFDRDLPTEFEAMELLSASGKSVQVGQPAQ